LGCENTPGEERLGQTNQIRLFRIDLHTDTIIDKGLFKYIFDIQILKKRHILKNLGYTYGNLVITQSCREKIMRPFGKISLAGVCK